MTCRSGQGTQSCFHAMNTTSRCLAASRHLASTALGFLLMSQDVQADIPRPTTGLVGIPEPGTQESQRDRTTLFAVTFAENTFVAVGALGAVATSTDGLQWTWHPPACDRHLRAVVRGPELWVAVGDGGTIVTSPDLETWTARTTGTPGNLHDATFGGGLYVVVGDNGGVLTSPDAISWRRRDTGSSKSLRTVRRAGDWYYAGGMDRTLLRSRDGRRWRQALPPGCLGISDMLWTDGRLLLAGCSGVYAMDADEARPRGFEAIVGSPSLRAIALSPDLIVAVGRQGTIVTRWRSGAEGWEWARSHTHHVLEGVAYGNGRYVAVGCAGVILVSENGRAWRRR